MTSIHFINTEYLYSRLVVKRKDNEKRMLKAAEEDIVLKGPASKIIELEVLTFQFMDDHNKTRQTNSNHASALSNSMSDLKYACEKSEVRNWEIQDYR